MATEFTQEAILQFLTERGGRVRNVELIDHFKFILPSDPGKKALAKETFKGYVDNVAFVKVENGVKIVCLKKKYRGSLKRTGERGDGECNGNGITADKISILKRSECVAINKALNDRNNSFGDSVQSHDLCEENSNIRASDRAMSTPDDGDERSLTLETVANDDAKRKMLPWSGYGTDNGKGAEVQTCVNILEGKTSATTANSNSVRISPEDSLLAMGNIFKYMSTKTFGDATEVGCDRGCEETSAPEVCVPRIAVFEASPLPAEADDTVFDLPEPGGLEKQRAQTSEKLNRSSNQTVFKYEGEHDKGARGYGLLADIQAKPMPKTSEEDTEVAVGKGTPMAQLINRRRVSRGSQRSILSSNPSEDGTDEGPFDSASLSGSDYTPKSSRKNFIELMMNSSPQVRRSMAQRNSTYLSSRQRDRDSVKSDSDSVVSSTTDEDGGSVTLDPLEHEWMMCASDAHWESLHRLLVCEPNLVAKKDFVTGFTCLHWAAKQGKQEVLALLVNFAKKNAVPLNINARSSAGYTPLHLAAMHNHIEVVKLLVGAYDADVEVRDYSGKKASQYLSSTVAEDILDIIGAVADPGTESLERSGRWRLSKVLAANLMPIKLLNHPDEDTCDGGGLVKSKVVHRKSSMSKIKPRLHKIRFRTQIIHSTSFRETDDGEMSLKSPIKSRPISNLFG